LIANCTLCSAVLFLETNTRMYKIKDLGFTLIEIMITIAIIALLAAIGIPSLLRARMTANESMAQSSLKTMSTAIENFAAANDGEYPTLPSDLTDVTPPYLNRPYCGQTIQGYTYNCAGGTTGYTVVASPLNPGTTGDTTYRITTGGILTP